MARKIGSKDTKKRAGKRTAYETYEYWYDKYTKGHKAGWFSAKYSKQEFTEQYELAKRGGLKNPARKVAASQEYISRKFEKQYKKLYGQDLGDLRDKNTRTDLFTAYISKLISEGLSFEDAKEKFTDYFY